MSAPLNPETLVRAADMLIGYCEAIRRAGASELDMNHYLPEVEFIASELRNAALPPESPSL